jgi:CO/xanthine dehydrogenase FAD-binding subunit
MPEFEYLKPKSLKETLMLLSEYKSQARLIAGGTDLIARMKRGQEMPPVLINLREVQGLNYIECDNEKGLRIGATSLLADIEESKNIKNKFPLLSETAGMMASPGVRGQATIGGNLCNASPSADMGPALLVLEANFKLTSQNGERIVSAAEFFTGPGTTIMNTGEILSEIQIQHMPPQSGTAYLKQTRRKGADLAIVGIAVMVVSEGSASRRIDDIKIALGAVAPTPLRALGAENILKGKNLTEENMVEAARAAVSICKPISDARGSAEYRLKLVEVLLPRAIMQALEQIYRR